MNIDAIFKLAKETILEDGEHIPMLYVEFAELNELVIAPIIGFGAENQTTFDKQKLLFSIGRALSKEYLGLKVSCVAFVCEAWTSFVKHGDQFKYERPSEDPNRKEMLLVSTLDASSPPNLKQQAYRAEMLRDGSGELVDLLSKSTPLEVGHNRLLTAFLAGSLSTQLTDDEFTALLRKYGG